MIMVNFTEINDIYWIRITMIKYIVAIGCQKLSKILEYHNLSIKNKFLYLP